MLISKRIIININIYKKSYKVNRFCKRVLNSFYKINL